MTYNSGYHLHRCDRMNNNTKKRDRKKYWCDICEKDVCNIKEHNLRIHDTQNSLNYCQVCPKKYKMKQDLKIHIRRVHDKKIESMTYVCSICSTKFSSSISMKSHKLTQHVGLKLFCCDDCGREFSSSKGLKSHKMLSHTEGASFPCTECKKFFPHTIQ